MKIFTKKMLFVIYCLSISLITFGQATWTGTTSNDWQTTGNWSTGIIPTSTTDVTIPNVTNQPIIDDGTTVATCQMMTIEAGADITIAYNGQLTVNWGITNNAGITGLIVQSNSSGDGSLIVNNSVTATIERYLPANRWNYLATPISSAPTTLFSSGEINYYAESSDDYWTSSLYQYNTTSGWLPASGNLSISNGFAFYDIANKTVSYTGTLNYTGALEVIPVNYTSHPGTATNGVLYTELDGWNLLGNKYTCALDWQGMTRADMDNGVYYFTGSNYAYYIWDGTTGTSINGGTRYIPAQQAFFVKTGKSTGGTLKIPLSARVHDETQFWKNTKTPTPENFIRIQAVVNSNTDETVVRYVDGATIGYDGAYDAYKMFSPDNAVPQVFTKATGVTTELAINSFPISNNTVSVPVGIRAADGATVNFNITELNFPNADYIYLYDSYQNIYTNLKTTSTYQFIHTTGVVSDRFVLYIGVNQAPQIVNQITNQNANEDETFTLNASNVFQDFDVLDQITYEAAIVIGKETSTWITFDNQTLTFSGTPTNNDVGVYNIILKATDTYGVSSYCSFTVTVINLNDSPMVINSIGVVETNEDELFNFDVHGNIEDVDVGDILTYSAKLTNGNALPTWLSFNPTTLIFSGTPTNEQVSIYEITLKAEDILLASAEITFVISVLNTNDSPIVINTISNVETDEDALFVLDVHGNIEDPDMGDVLTYSATLTDNSALPAWLTFNPQTLLFSGIPTNDNIGNYQIKLKAQDVALQSIETNFTITVLNTNDAPTLETTIPNQIIWVQGPSAFSISLDIFNDVDVNDVLTISVSINGNALPNWITFDDITNTLNALPNIDNLGNYIVEVAATDIAGTSVSTSFILAVDINGSVESVSKYGISIYPNPTTGIVNISKTKGFDNIIVYDLVGKIILNKNINKNNESTEINLSGNQSGIYFIKLNSKDKSLFYKLLIK